MQAVMILLPVAMFPWASHTYKHNLGALFTGSALFTHNLGQADSKIVSELFKYCMFSGSIRESVSCPNCYVKSSSRCFYDSLTQNQMHAAL